jgi:hypothetical protein
VNTLSRRAFVRRSCADATDALRRLGDEGTVFVMPHFCGRLWIEADGAAASWLCLDGVFPVTGYRAALAGATRQLARIARAIEAEPVSGAGRAETQTRSRR